MIRLYINSSLVVDWKSFFKSSMVMSYEGFPPLHTKQNGKGYTGRCVLILGLDKTGKTALMYRLVMNIDVTTISTYGIITITNFTHSYQGFNCEGFRTFYFQDVGGKSTIRSLWVHYAVHVRLLIWIVDSTDYQRIEESKTELHKVHFILFFIILYYFFDFSFLFIIYYFFINFL